MSERSEHIHRALSDDGVLTLTIARPEKKNALTIAMYETLVDDLASASDDDDVRVVLIRGDGGVFTAGNDLFDFAQNPPTGLDSPVMRFLFTLAEYQKPIVAAVQGPAVGIGITMLLHCDLVYADKTAKLKAPFTDLALCAEGGSSLLMPRMFGFAQAGRLLLLSEAITADEAHAMGLVTEVFEAASFMRRVEEKAAALARKAPEAVRITKELMRGPMREQAKAVLTNEAIHFAQCLVSDEAREAFSAFIEKRAPDFSKKS